MTNASPAALAKLLATQCSKFLVFEVPEKMKVKEGVDYSAYESEIKDAADSCPAGVIKYE